MGCLFKRERLKKNIRISFLKRKAKRMKYQAGQVVACQRTGRLRHGVVLETSVADDFWRYFTVQWVRDGYSADPEVCRYDQVTIVDPMEVLEALQRSIALSRAVKTGPVA